MTADAYINPKIDFICHSELIRSLEPHACYTGSLQILIMLMIHYFTGKSLRIFNLALGNVCHMWVLDFALV